MKKTNFAVLVICIAFMAVGLGGGYVIASRMAPKEAPAVGNDVHGGEADQCTLVDPTKLSPQALKNLGVTVADIDERPYTKCQNITATVVESPLSEQPVFAPVGGKIIRVAVAPGGVAKSGDVILEILRDPISRPTLAVSEEVLKPANEEHHKTVLDMTKALRNIEVLKAEIGRVSKYSESTNKEELPLLPKKGLIDLRYDLSRAEQDLASHRIELKRHGYTDAQVAEVEAGKPLVILGPEMWKSLLERNHLWPQAAESLFKSLPKETQERPLTLKVVAELGATGLVSTELAKWFQTTPDATQYFMEVASLLQQGNTLNTIKLLYEQDGLQPVVKVRAPGAADVADWDVHELLVRAGEKVEAGKKLVTFENSRQMLLKVISAGGEVALIQKALKSDQELEAVPVTPDGGPLLTKLYVEYMKNEEGGQGTVAYVKATNQPLHVRGEPVKFRTWSLRAGQKYFLRVPTTKIDAAYVLPPDAITEDGADKVVFVKSGDKFKPAKVVILHQDRESVVLDTKSSELFPGDPVVQHGAFGLGLALKLGSGQPVVDCCGHPHGAGGHTHKH